MGSSLIVKLGGNDKKKTRVAAAQKVDNLPDNLIDSILERLPIKDAVRTSILSRNWRYKWTTMSSMVLDEHFSNKLPKNDIIFRDVFITITNQLLFKFLKGPISKVHLHIPRVSLENSFFEEQVKQWIQSLSTYHHGVRELVLHNSNQRDLKLPLYLFHCSELKKLQLSRLMFKPPPTLEFPQGYFLNLQHLSLLKISFEETHDDDVIIKLPQLKKMCLVMCTHVYNFNIMAPKLKSIRLISCVDAMFLRLLQNSSQSLTTVHFVMNTPYPEIQKVNLVPVLCNLPYLASLTMNGYFFKSCIVDNIPKWLSHAANRLKTLTFINLNFGDLYQLQSALYLLRNSPNLKELGVKTLGKNQDRHKNMHLDVKSALTYLEAAASGCFDQTLRRLKTVIITRVAGSKPLLLFIKLLLNHSPALEMISIQPSVVTDVDVPQSYNNFAEDVTCFPRASSKAELLFLDP